MVDPLEAVIQHLRREAGLTALVGPRIANRSQVGDGWAKNAPALVLRLDGGPTDVDTPRQLLRIETRCLGNTQQNAMAVYAALVAATRTAERVTVDTTTGRALIYWMSLESGASQLADPDTDQPMVLTFINAAVAELATA